MQHTNRRFSLRSALAALTLLSWSMAVAVTLHHPVATIWACGLVTALIGLVIGRFFADRTTACSLSVTVLAFCVAWSIWLMVDCC